jgi:hypothetical protein
MVPVLLFREIPVASMHARHILLMSGTLYFYHGALIRDDYIILKPGALLSDRPRWIYILPRGRIYLLYHLEYPVLGFPGNSPSLLPANP